MKSRRVLLQSAAALVALSLAGPVAAQSAGPMPVVATFSILGDMVNRIGGKHIALTTLVGPDGNTVTQLARVSPKLVELQCHEAIIKDVGNYVHTNATTVVDLKLVRKETGRGPLPWQWVVTWKCNPEGE